MRKRSDDIKILQVVAKENQLYGLGSDSMMYMWNFDDNTWVIYDYSDTKTEFFVDR